MRLHIALVATVFLSLFVARSVHADNAPVAPDGVLVPLPPELPTTLTLDDTLRIFRARGLDLLIADAQVNAAEGDVHAARAVPNPNVSAGAGPVFNYSAKETTDRPCPGCQQYAVQWGISDNGAIFDSLSGKRGLRIDASRAALKSARLTRTDAERQLIAQVKQAFIGVALAKQALEFSQEVQKSLTQTLDLSKLRYPSVINEGDLARIEVQKLEADQGADGAQLTVRQAQVALAMLLGVRGAVPDFDVDRSLDKFVVPNMLTATSEQDLFNKAIEARPDLKSALAQMDRADASLALAERQRFPDVALFAQYTQLGMGQNVGQPMNLIFGLSMNLPVFYQQKGEVMKAEADRDTQALQRQKTLAQIASDVTQSWAAFTASRDLVQRMEGSLLERAKRAKEIIEVQYKNGGATLIDFLDAQRTYIATNLEYLSDLSAYWSSVYQLEQAIGTEIK